MTRLGRWRRGRWLSDGTKEGGGVGWDGGRDGPGRGGDLSHNVPLWPLHRWMRKAQAAICWQGQEFALIPLGPKELLISVQTIIVFLFSAKSPPKMVDLCVWSDVLLRNRRIPSRFALSPKLLSSEKKSKSPFSLPTFYAREKSKIFV